MGPLPNTPILFPAKTDDLFAHHCQFYQFHRRLNSHDTHSDSVVITTSNTLQCCKNLPVLLWGPLFVRAPVRPNMLNTPKSASAKIFTDIKTVRKLQFTP